MKQNKEWTDAVKDALRDAEAMPPADGWARLERELGSIPPPRVPVWRVYRTRIAAAAAVVAGVVAGGYLWHTTPDSVGFDGTEIVAAVGGGQTVNEQTVEEHSAAVQLPTAVAEKVAKGESLLAVAADEGMMSLTAVHSLVSEKAGRSEGREEDSVAESAGSVQADAATAADLDGMTAHTEASAESRKSHTTTRSAAVLSADEQARRLYGDDYAMAVKPVSRRRSSLSLHAGGVVTGKNSAVGSVNLLAIDASSILPDEALSMQPLSRYDYPESEFRHHQPLSFGVAVRKEFAHGLSLESGVNYTLLRSEVDLTHGTESISQKLHFIGVPLRLNWQFLERGRFSLYIGAGGMVEKCVLAKFGTKSVAEQKVQWSVLGVAGAQYRLGGIVGLYFEPEMSYYFTDTNLRTSRSDSPLTLTLRLGVRLSF